MVLSLQPCLYNPEASASLASGLQSYVPWLAANSALCVAPSNVRTARPPRSEATCYSPTPPLLLVANTAKWSRARLTLMVRVRAAVNAPFWSEELHRDLLKAVVKVWLAISSGRFQDERYLACCEQPGCRSAHRWYLGAFYHRNHHGGLTLPSGHED